MMRVGAHHDLDALIPHHKMTDNTHMAVGLEINTAQREKASWGPLLILALGLYQFGLLRSEGLFEDVAIKLLCAVLLAILFGLLLGFSNVIRPRMHGFVLTASITLIVLEMFWTGQRVMQTGQLPAVEKILAGDSQPIFKTRLSLMLAVISPGIFGMAAIVFSRRRWVWLLIMAVLQMGIFTWLIRQTPSPFIDVWVFQQDGPKELLAGRNPYAMTFPNIYGPGAAVYSPEVMQGDRIRFGFPYPPMTMWSVLPSYALLGECRYAHALGWVATSLLIAGLARSRLASAAAVIVLLNPMIYHMIEFAWTESLIVPLLGLTILCAMRFPRWTPVALGVLLASKQYFVMIVPVTMLLIPRPWNLTRIVKFYLAVGVVGLAVSIPLVLWDLGAFWWSNVTIQIKQPFRWDSISVLAYIYNAASPETQKLWGSGIPSPWDKIAFPLAAVMWVLAFWKLPRNAWGFSMAVTTVMLVFLLFNRQAFLNYHILVSASLAMSLALMSTNPKGNLDSEAQSQDATQP